MKENNQKDKKNIPNHAPGKGSDKQHPNTPNDANERFKKQQNENVQENPGKQNTG